MTYFKSISAALALSVLAVAGTSQASLASGTDTAAVQSVQGGQYTLRRIDALDSYWADKVKARAAVNAGAVQQAIRSNPELVRDLTSRHVQIDNIVEASKALDGGVILYLR